MSPSETFFVTSEMELKLDGHVIIVFKNKTSVGFLQKLKQLEAKQYLFSGQTVDDNDEPSVLEFFPSAISEERPDKSPGHSLETVDTATSTNHLSNKRPWRDGLRLCELEFAASALSTGLTSELQFVRACCRIRQRSEVLGVSVTARHCDTIVPDSLAPQRAPPPRSWTWLA